MIHAVLKNALPIRGHPAPCWQWTVHNTLEVHDHSQDVGGHFLVLRVTKTSVIPILFKFPGDCFISNTAKYRSWHRVLNHEEPITSVLQTVTALGLLICLQLMFYFINLAVKLLLFGSPRFCSHQIHLSLNFVYHVGMQREKGWPAIWHCCLSSLPYLFKTWNWSGCRTKGDFSYGLWTSCSTSQTWIIDDLSHRSLRISACVTIHDVNTLWQSTG